MVSITQIIGGPGTGKTTRGMQIVEDAIGDGIESHEIGYSSFTRAAVATAASRASGLLGVEPDELTKNGWYRTLHSAIYKMLGVSANQMLVDDKKTKEWFSELFGRATNPPKIDIDSGFLIPSESDPLGRMLEWWSSCRNKLLSVEQSRKSYPGTMPFDDGMRMIERYERKKHIDCKLDFTDLILRYAGIRYSVDGIRYGSPQGGVPDVRMWILDEYQDTFPAMHQAAARLVSGESVDRIFCLGDPFQSIHGHSGGSPEFLMHGFDYTAQEVLRQSWRCPPAVMRLAESVIAQCSDYFDRRIAPREDAAGRVESMWLEPRSVSQTIHGDSGDWLIIARTNSQASRLSNFLTKQGIPWSSTVGGSYLPPKRRHAANTAYKLHSGKQVTRDEWVSLASLLKTTHAGQPILRRGFKTEITEGIPSGMSRMIDLVNLASNGGTEFLVDVIRQSSWCSLHEGFDKFLSAVNTSGITDALNPRIRTGTIHSVKGDEAWNVMLYDSLTSTCRANLANNTTKNEERRVWYVGVSRAKHRLITARFQNDKIRVFR